MKKGIIYKVTNKINGKIYIGLTTQSLEERKADHHQKAKKGIGGSFQKAIRFYGSDSFLWEEIDEADNNNDLAKKEQYYITIYNTRINGYNVDKGGAIKKVVHRFNMLNILIAKYESLSSAGKAVGADKRKISHACTFGKFYKGSYWSYDPKPSFKNKGDLRKKSVLQYDIEHNLLHVYISASEASRQMGVSKTCITRCCREEREQSGGFKWKYN